MSYRRILITRWSRRDRLTIVVVAVAVAFLVGTVILVSAASAQTTAIAGQYTATESVSTYSSIETAREAADPDDRVVPFALVSTPDGQTRYLVSRQALSGGRAFNPGSGPTGSKPPAAGTVTRGDIQTTQEQQLTHDGKRVTVSVAPRGATVVPRSWYLAPQSLVEKLTAETERKPTASAAGEVRPDGAFVVHTVSEGTLPLRGTPLKGALPFFVFGSQEALRALTIVAGGSAILIGVVIYSVTRMTVRDRRRTIRIVRATGGRRTALLGVFGVRAALVATVGVAVGYATGVILVNAVVNLAVFLGLPIALDIALTWPIARLIVIICCTVVSVAAISGILAAVPAVRGDIIQRSRSHSDTTLWEQFVPNVAQPQLLDQRALIPTAATLATFIAFIIVVAGISGVLGPLTASNRATITEPGATHPIASNVPATTAGALQRDGIDASAEILLFESTDGQPYIARGANFSDFSSVTDTTLVAGRQPRSTDDAVIGRALARTLDVERGDRIVLGGITTRRVARVTVVGVFDAPGPFDDQLVVSLQTAQHLARKSQGTVQFVRADRLPENTSTSVRSDVEITALSVPAVVPPNGSVPVQLTVSNPTDTSASRTFRIQFDGHQRQVSTTLQPSESTQLQVSFTAGTEDASVRVGDQSREVIVGSTAAVQFAWLPAAAPPNTTFVTRVQTVTGTPAANATVHVDGDRIPVRNGRVRIPTGPDGSAEIVVENQNTTLRRTVPVQRNASRAVRLSLTISPTEPNLLTRPTATLQVINPWNTTIERTVRFAGPETTTTRTITVMPQSTTQHRVSLSRQPPGTYDLTATTNIGEQAQTSYRVTGDDRIAATIAGGGAAGSSGIGQTIESAFGNLQLVLTTLLVLAGLMTVGGTTAAFAQSIHARRQTIGVYRATGATQRGVARIVLSDSLRLGVVAISGAVGGGYIMMRLAERAGFLTVFGVRLPVTPSPVVIGGAVLGGLLVTLAGAGLATLSLITVDPGMLLYGEGSAIQRQRRGETAGRTGSLTDSDNSEYAGEGDTDGVPVQGVSSAPEEADS